MPMRRLALLMHPDTFPCIVNVFFGIKTLHFYAKLYLEDDFAQTVFEQITAIFR